MAGLSGVVSSALHTELTLCNDMRRDLIDVAARTARHGRGEITLHLAGGWHREQEWMNLFEAACRPPPARAA
jgi:hypothetical protein